ncbi:MAG: LysR family transcriptional regulator [Pseudomonadota bacterium]
MPLWDGLEEFLMVAETGGFSAAGKRLRVSTSHVSRQVSRLEDRLGVKLFARSTRVVKLTEAGADYFAKISDLAAGVEEANQSATGASRNLAGRIRVSAAGTFAEDHVAPALAEFARRHPKIMIEMDFNTRNVDLIDQGFDFAIRYGALTDSGLIAKKLCGRQMVCAASPEFLERNRIPLHPNDLRQLECLRTNTDRWTFRDPETEQIFDVRINGRWVANNGHALRHGAEKSLGIAYSPKENLAASLESGKLLPILDNFADTTRSSWLVYPERRHLPLRVRKAMDYLSNKFEDRA